MAKTERFLVRLLVHASIPSHWRRNAARNVSCEMRISRFCRIAPLLFVSSLLLAAGAQAAEPEVLRLNTYEIGNLHLLDIRARYLRYPELERKDGIDFKRFSIETNRGRFEIQGSDGSVLLGGVITSLTIAGLESSAQVSNIPPETRIPAEALQLTVRLERPPIRKYFGATIEFPPPTQPNTPRRVWIANSTSVVVQPARAQGTLSFKLHPIFLRQAHIDLGIPGVVLVQDLISADPVAGARFDFTLDNKRLEIKRGSFRSLKPIQTAWNIETPPPDTTTLQLLNAASRELILNVGETYLSYQLLSPSVQVSGRVLRTVLAVPLTVIGTVSATRLSGALTGTEVAAYATSMDAEGLTFEPAAVEDTVALVESRSDTDPSKTTRAIRRRELSAAAASMLVDLQHLRADSLTRLDLTTLKDLLRTRSKRGNLRQHEVLGLPGELLQTMSLAPSEPAYVLPLELVLSHILTFEKGALTSYPEAQAFIVPRFQLGRATDILAELPRFTTEATAIQNAWSANHEPAVIPLGISVQGKLNVADLIASERQIGVRTSAAIFRPCHGAVLTGPSGVQLIGDFDVSCPQAVRSAKEPVAGPNTYGEAAARFDLIAGSLSDGSAPPRDTTDLFVRRRRILDAVSDAFNSSSMQVSSSHSWRTVSYTNTPVVRTPQLEIATGTTNIPQSCSGANESWRCGVGPLLEATYSARQIGMLRFTTFDDEMRLSAGPFKFATDSNGTTGSITAPATISGAFRANVLFVADKPFTRICFPKASDVSAVADDLLRTYSGTAELIFDLHESVIHGVMNVMPRKHEASVPASPLFAKLSGEMTELSGCTFPFNEAFQVQSKFEPVEFLEQYELFPASGFTVASITLPQALAASWTLVPTASQLHAVFTPQREAVSLP